jgi:hypothetical protein
MGIVAEKRAERLLEEALLEYLEEGVAPTPEELLDTFQDRRDTLRDLVSSSISEEVFPQRWEVSSATKVNKFFESFYSDFLVLSRGLVDVTKLCISTNADWSTRAKALEGRLRALQSRIESLILLKADTAGFLAFVEDGFFTLDEVANGTSVEVDVATGEASLAVDPSSGTGAESGTLLDLRGSDITWTMLSGSSVRYSLSQTGQELENILSGTRRSWGVEVESSRTGKVAPSTTSRSSLPVAAGELKIKLSGLTQISKVSMLMDTAAAGSPSVINFQYSLDGYSWALPDTPSTTQSGTGNFVFRFPKTEVRFIKFLIAKSSPDGYRDGASIYDFGIREVKVYSEEYVVEEGGGILITEVRTPILGGSDVSFSRASLEVCEEVPVDTSIDYYLRASNLLGTTPWTLISPLSREAVSAPAVVDFGSLEEVDTAEITTVFDSALDAEALNLARIDGAGSLLYRFGGPGDTVVNFYLTADIENLLDPVLLRNIGYKASKFPAVTEDLLVGEVPCGWGLSERETYVCSFLIKAPEGREIDFGSSGVKIDGQIRSGAVLIPPGWHTFETAKVNWLSLTGANPVNETELRDIDPLYPYNHKYLIEGFSYQEAFREGRVYLGADLYCQTRATRVGRYTLLGTSEFDPNIFALETIGDRTAVLLKYNPSDGTHVNERARLFYTVSEAEYTGVEMKAILKTLTSRRTPILTYYRIRVK